MYFQGSLVFYEFQVYQTPQCQDTAAIDLHPSNEPNTGGDPLFLLLTLFEKARKAGSRSHKHERIAAGSLHIAGAGGERRMDLQSAEGKGSGSAFDTPQLASEPDPGAAVVETASVREP